MAHRPTVIFIDKLKASGDICIDLLFELINDTINDSVIPQDWQVNSTFDSYSGKGDTAECGNYRSLKLLDHVIKLLEKIV